MILAEKIMMLRKKNGWSQEDLASELEVSRQAVSKWESGASIPDLDKILKLSQLFGVSTDYLLKDQMEELIFTPTEEPANETGRQVSMEEADRFLNLSERFSKRIGLGVVLFILSPISVILLGGLAKTGRYGITESMAGGFGAAVLLILVAIGVAICVVAGLQLSPYEYLEKEEIFLAYGVAGVVEKRKAEFFPVFQLRIVSGVALCILGAVPILVGAAVGMSELGILLMVCFLLCMVAAAVFLFIWGGVIEGSFDKLLQQGDYSSEQKQMNRKLAPFPGIYWCLMTAIYLWISFSKNDWSRSWIIWPVAGVFFAAIQGILQMVVKNQEQN